MPAESEAQRRWAFGVKGPAWSKAHHFDNPGKLPKRVKKMQGGGVIATCGKLKNHGGFAEQGIKR